MQIKIKLVQIIPTAIAKQIIHIKNRFIWTSIFLYNTMETTFCNLNFFSGRSTIFLYSLLNSTIN